MANEKRLIDGNKAQAVLVNMVEHLMEAGNPEMAGAVGYAAEVIGKQPTVDAVEVVRCKDCKHFKSAHFKADDGTESPWDETFNWDDRSDGIYHGGKCKHERNTAYGQKDMAFRKPDDFCSYGERRDND